MDPASTVIRSIDHFGRIIFVQERRQKRSEATHPTRESFDRGPHSCKYPQARDLFQFFDPAEEEFALSER